MTTIDYSVASTIRFFTPKIKNTRNKKCYRYFLRNIVCFLVKAI